MDVGNVQIGSEQIARFRLASMRDLDELESGVYWPTLQPYFLRPQFRRLRYRINERGVRPPAPNGAAAMRGASGLGELDVAYIRDRPAASMVITDTGLPDYCLTAVTRGSLECSGTQKTGTFAVTASHGLVYRGLPGTALSAAQDHERIAIWIPAASLQQRLSALVGGPVTEDIIFEPVFEWANASMQSLRRQLWLLTAELGPENSFVSNEIACRSYIDLLLYTLLRSVPSNYSGRLANRASPAVPGTVRRAEEYIRSHAAQPIALHEVAEAAGCSVRSLQVGFRQFRDITPAEAIIQARLDAVREALVSPRVGRTVTDVALEFGFTNPGRFSRLYRMRFGDSPARQLRA
jgi:AraC-like DNA-binding protein